MKKILLTLLASAILLTSCSNQNASETTAVNEESGSTTTEKAAKEETEKSSEIEASESTPIGDIKLSIFQSKVEIAESLEAVAANYTASTGIEVEVWGSAGDDYRNQLQAKISSGEGPVIFSLGGKTELDQFSQYVTDLSNESYVQNIADGMSLVSEDGTVYGIPYGVEGYGLVINTDLVDPTSDLASTDTLSALFDQLSNDGVAPLLLSSENYFLIAHILDTAFGMQDDPQDFIDKLNSGEAKMADEPIFQDLAKVLEDIKNKSTNPLEITYDSQIAAFAEGEAAMIHQGNWAYGMFSDYDVAFDMTLAALPISGNKKIPVGVGGYWCINSDADEAQLVAAKDFFNFLFDSDEGMDILINDFGFIPAFTNAAFSTEDPLSLAVFEYVKNGETIPWTNSTWPQGIIDTSLAPEAQNFFSDPSMTGEEFLKALDTAWENAPK